LLKHSVATIITASALTGENTRLPRKILWLVCHCTQCKEYIYRMNDSEKNFFADGCFLCSHIYILDLCSRNILHLPKREKS